MFGMSQMKMVKETFLDFVEVERITGRALSDAILHWLDVNGLSVADMRGQCYDGASNMSGSRAGCQALIQKEAPKAVYVHCSSHKLNLAIVFACKISSFKSTESYIGEVSRFFAYSPETEIARSGYRIRRVIKQSQEIKRCMQNMVGPTNRFLRCF